MIVRTFLDAEELADKTLISPTTHLSYGLGNTLPNIRILDEFLAFNMESKGGKMGRIVV